MECIVYNQEEKNRLLCRYKYADMILQLEVAVKELVEEPEILSQLEVLFENIWFPLLQIQNHLTKQAVCPREPDSISRS